MEVPEDLDLLALLVEAIACGSVEGGEVLCDGYSLVYTLLHLPSTTYELPYVEARYSDRE